MELTLDSDGNIATPRYSWVVSCVSAALAMRGQAAPVMHLRV